MLSSQPMSQAAAAAAVSRIGQHSSHSSSHARWNTLSVALPAWQQGKSPLHTSRHGKAAQTFNQQYTARLVSRTAPQREVALQHTMMQHR
jgi:hypothetical protein